MNGQLTEISNFRFDSLRKYMQPVYFTLNHHANDTKEKKHEIFRSLIPQFYRRLRIYREVTIEAIAERSKVSTDELYRFEDGDLKTTLEIESAYCRVCSGDHEREFFARRLHEFLHPSVRESREAIAMDALKRFGVVMPDVDYANLNSPKGTVLAFNTKAADRTAMRR